MSWDVIGPLSVPILWGLYRIFRRKYDQALGMFIAAAIALPILLLMNRVPFTPKLYYTVGAFYLIVTVGVIGFLLRRKAHKR